MQTIVDLHTEHLQHVCWMTFVSVCKSNEACTAVIKPRTAQVGTVPWRFCALSAAVSGSFDALETPPLPLLSCRPCGMVQDGHAASSVF